MHLPSSLKSYWSLPLSASAFSQARKCNKLLTPNGPAAQDTQSMRKIIHCDCDSFYASVEMRDDPSLRDLPIAVGGSASRRGVIATCNYEARKYGLHSAMPMAQALRLCPDLVVVPTNMEKYRIESRRVQSIFYDYTDLVEPLSLDEAFLDVSECQLHQGSATRIAEEIRNRVRQEVGITISAGIAPNKFLAKIASDWDKPDGQFTITPPQIENFMADLPVAKIFGVGSVTAKKMSAMGIHTCGDLQSVSATDLAQRFGKFGTRLYQLCRGQDERPVTVNRIRKSVSTERTFAEDLPDLSACQSQLDILFADLEKRIAKARCQHRIKSRTLKLRFQGFDTTTVASTGQDINPEIYRQLLRTAWERQEKPVRLIGLGVQLRELDNPGQTDLFDAGEELG
jgi:DNA polymerase-4